jgi:hypothetical protein
MSKNIDGTKRKVKKEKMMETERKNRSHRMRMSKKKMKQLTEIVN